MRIQPPGPVLMPDDLFAPGADYLHEGSPVGAGLAAQASSLGSLSPSPLVGEGWGEGEFFPNNRAGTPAEISAATTRGLLVMPL